MKKIALSILAASTILSSSGFAFMGLNAEAGVGTWVATMSGDATYKNSGVDFEKLGLDSSANTYIYADFSHFVPIIPNVRIEQQKVNITGKGNAAGNSFGNLVLDTDTATDISMTQNDFILYWSVPLLSTATAGVLDINFGLDMKNITGDMTLKSNAGTETADLDFTIPLGYVAATVDPPFIPLEFMASVKTISYKGSSISDNMIKMSYTLPIPTPLIDIRLDLGYKQQSLEISDELIDNFSATIDNDGMFFGLSAKF